VFLKNDSLLSKKFLSFIFYSESSLEWFWKIDSFFLLLLKWSVDEREMKQFENDRILFFIFFVIVKWEHGWLRAVLWLTDSLFFIIILKMN